MMQTPVLQRAPAVQALFAQQACPTCPQLSGVGAHAPAAQ
jgi:hypothetical protein